MVGSDSLTDMATEPALDPTDDLRRSERLLLAAERERIARDLHDHVIQRMFAVGLSLEALAMRTAEGEVRRRLERAVEEVDDAIRELRSSVYDLRSLSYAGKNLRRRLGDIAAAASSPSMPVTMRIDGPVDTLVSAGVAEHVEAVTREAISNAVRHSGGTEVSVRVEVGDDVTVTVTDDGHGIPADASRRGLNNLVTRAEACGGGCVVTSSGDGTVVRWSAPAMGEV